MPFWPFRRRKPEAPATVPELRKHWSTHISGPRLGWSRGLFEAASKKLQGDMARPQGVAMDDNSNGMPKFKHNAADMLPDALTGWFLGQGFIGYQTCAMISQNWLVNKALWLPARDAIRHGWDIHIGGMSVPEGADVDAQEGKIVERIKELDKDYRVAHNLQQFVALGRMFGVRVLLFRVEGIDYEKPFNIDGVKPGSYRGMSQVDPYWCIPELDSVSLADPADPHFYEPTWWVINGQRYHRTHLRIFRPIEVPDVLKSQYHYGGIPVPQLIVERVYAAERTANEGPQLAMTKRTMVWQTDLGELYGNQEKAAMHMQHFTEYRDNYGVKVNDTNDTMTQFDTGLADLDTTIMTQYQLVAAIANVPATKLLGTTPKGFNATGEYEESSYHEELETIQANDLSGVLERHYDLLLRSEIEPEQKVAPGTLRANVDWAAVDSPTAKEYAEINKINADTDLVLSTAGAIDAMDIRNRVKMDPNSGYTGIADPELDTEALIAEVMNGTEAASPDENPEGLGGSAGRSDIQGQAPVAPVAARTPLPSPTR